jgi:hypothetical protein
LWTMTRRTVYFADHIDGHGFILTRRPCEPDCSCVCSVD